MKSLGKKGEIVNVSDGYARNFVLPKKLGACIYLLPLSLSAGRRAYSSTTFTFSLPVTFVCSLMEANTSNMNDLKLQKANADKVAQEQLEAARELAALLETKEVVLKMKSGEGGRAFGSVSSKEIAAAAMTQCGLEPRRTVCYKNHHQGRSRKLR